MRRTVLFIPKTLHILRLILYSEKTADWCPIFIVHAEILKSKETLNSANCQLVLPVRTVPALILLTPTYILLLNPVNIFPLIPLCKKLLCGQVNIHTASINIKAYNAVADLFNNIWLRPQRKIFWGVIKSKISYQGTHYSIKKHWKINLKPDEQKSCIHHNSHRKQNDYHRILLSVKSRWHNRLIYECDKRQCDHHIAQRKMYAHPAMRLRCPVVLPIAPII